MWATLTHSDFIRRQRKVTEGFSAEQRHHHLSVSSASPWSESPSTVERSFNIEVRACPTLLKTLPWLQSATRPQVTSLDLELMHSTPCTNPAPATPARSLCHHRALLWMFCLQGMFFPTNILVAHSLTSFLQIPAFQEDFTGYPIITYMHMLVHTHTHMQTHMPSALMTPCVLLCFLLVSTVLITFKGIV